MRGRLGLAVLLAVMMTAPLYLGLVDPAAESAGDPVLLPPSQGAATSTVSTLVQPTGEAGVALLGWQPADNGAIAGAAFNATGGKLAAVDSDNDRLTVWNTSGNRVLAYIALDDRPADVAWVDDDVVLVMDDDGDWASFVVVDDGGYVPLQSVPGFSGDWSDGMTGGAPINARELEVTPDGSAVVFCGNRGSSGQVVIADSGWFTGAENHNARTRNLPDPIVDCAISSNSTTVGAIVDVPTNNIVVSIGVDDAREYGDRNISLLLDDATALAFRPGTTQLLVAMSAPTETQVRRIDWSTFAEPSPPTIISDRAAVDMVIMPNGGPIAVALEDLATATEMNTSNIQFISQAGGNPLALRGWHAEPITRLTVSPVGDLVTSAGEDGSLETWAWDSGGNQPEPGRRFASTEVLDADGFQDGELMATAESNGVATVRLAITGEVTSQCMHPDYGLDNVEPADAVAVSVLPTGVVVGFSDGVVARCNAAGQLDQSWDASIGRNLTLLRDVDMHPNGKWLAVTWGENTTDPTLGGEIGIIAPANGTMMGVFHVAQAATTIAWTPDGTGLGIGLHNGEVTMLGVSGDEADGWALQSVSYVHADRVNAISWVPDARFQRIVSVSDDRTALGADIKDGVPLFTQNLLDEGQSVTHLLGRGSVLVGSGDPTDSGGQFELRNSTDGTVEVRWLTAALPVGVTVAGNGLVMGVAEITGAISTFLFDRDEDGVVDEEDWAPDDKTQWEDLDGDGVGDNHSFELDLQTGLRINETGDAFPNDFDQSRDTDGDGLGDNYAFDLNPTTGLRENERGDAFPLDASQQTDQDGDGHGDNYTYRIFELTGLRGDQVGDAFPTDPTQWRDTDGDTVGDNYAFEVGNDSLRVNETGDAFPNDPEQVTDLDGDGCGDNYTYDLNTTTNLRVEVRGDALPTDSRFCSDADGDGVGNDAYTFDLNATTGLRENQVGDAFPDDPLQWLDTDGDECGDDYDFVTDQTSGLRTTQIGDAFPLDADQCSDTDGDGHGDEYTFIEDPSTGLRVDEAGDAFPLDNLAWSDEDGDGCPTASSTGLRIDLFPVDAAQCDQIVPLSLPEGINMTARTSGSNWLVRINWTGAAAHATNLTLYAGTGAPGSTCGAACEVGTGTVYDAWTGPFRAAQETALVPINGQDTVFLRLVATNDTGDFVDLWLNRSLSGADTGGNGPRGEDDPSSNTAIIVIVILVIIAAAGAGFMLLRGGGGGGGSGGGGGGNSASAAPKQTGGVIEPESAPADEDEPAA